MRSHLSGNPIPINKYLLPTMNSNSRHVSKTSFPNPTSFGISSPPLMGSVPPSTSLSSQPTYCRLLLSVRLQHDSPFLAVEIRRRTSLFLFMFKTLKNHYQSRSLPHPNHFITNLTPLIMIKKDYYPPYTMNKKHTPYHQNATVRD